MSFARVVAVTEVFASPLGAARASEICQQVLRLADADETEVSVTARRGEYTRFAGTRIHQAQDLIEWTIWVRCVVGGRSGRAATSDLGRLEETVRRASGAARQNMPGPVQPVGVNNASGPAGTPAMYDELWDPAVEGFDAAARSRKAQSFLVVADDAGALAYGMIGRAATEMAVATSRGLARYAAASEVHGSLTLKQGDGSSHWVDLDRRLDAFDIDAAFAASLEAAASTRGREELPAGSYDVVLGPTAVGGMLESFASFGFTGRSFAAGVGAAATRGGEQVAASAVTIADDAAHPRGLPFPFDMEGTDRQRVAMIDAGVVGGAVTDLTTAGRAGVTSSGHAHIAREESPGPVPANLVVEPGTGSVADLIEGVENGLFIERFWYLRVVDPAKTTLTGVSRDAAWRIRDGRLTTPIAGARWTENVFGVLSRVDGVSADVRAQPLSNIWNGCVTAPALRVRGFRFGPGAHADTTKGTEQ